MPFWLIDAFCHPEVQKSFFSSAHEYLRNRAILTPLQYSPICRLRYIPLHLWSLQLMDLQYRASKSTSHPYLNVLFLSQNFWVKSSQSFVWALGVLIQHSSETSLSAASSVFSPAWIFPFGATRSIFPESASLLIKRYLGCHSLVR